MAESNNGDFKTFGLGSYEMAETGISGMKSFGEAMQYYGLSVADDINSRLTNLSSGGVLAEGDYVGERMREKGDSYISTMVARYGKAGVRFSGSPIEAVRDSERNIGLDILMTKLNYTSKANELGFTALQQKIAAGQARTRALLKMSEGFLTMAATGYSLGAGTPSGGGGGGGAYKPQPEGIMG